MSNQQSATASFKTEIYAMKNNIVPRNINYTFNSPHWLHSFPGSGARGKEWKNLENLNKKKESLKLKFYFRFTPATLALKRRMNALGAGRSRKISQTTNFSHSNLFCRVSQEKCGKLHASSAVRISTIFHFFRDNSTLMWLI